MTMTVMDSDRATPTARIGSASNPMYDMSKVNESSFKVSSALVFVLHNLCVSLIISSLELWLLLQTVCCFCLQLTP